MNQYLKFENIKNIRKMQINRPYQFAFNGILYDTMYSIILKDNYQFIVSLNLKILWSVGRPVNAAVCM